MAIFPVRTSAFLAALCATLPMAAAMPANAAPLQLFSSCQTIHQVIPAAPDGNYVLFNNGRVLTVYCHGMRTGTPAEYINLARTGQSVNFSQYTAGGASPGTNVRTRFTKLRVNPSTLTVDIGDLTFASSTGSLQHGGETTVTGMPYGVAMACVGQQADGQANINLQGTPFRVDNGFDTGGFTPAGTANETANRQVVDLRGGGFCGWMMPTPVQFNPFNPSPGMYNLKLNCTTLGVAPGQLCLATGNPARLKAQAGRRDGKPVSVVRIGGHEVEVVGAGNRVAS